MNQNEYLFEELDSIMFRQIWGLIYEKASEYLRVTARTIAAYGEHPNCLKTPKGYKPRAIQALDAERLRSCSDTLPGYC
jgi:hypothetical protein